MRANKGSLRTNRKYYWIIGVCLLIQVLIFAVKDNPVWVEKYYARLLYPLLSYGNIILFSWLPFSVGDLFYVFIILTLLFGLLKLGRSFFIKNWSLSIHLGLKISTLILVVYTLFYVNWGLNYYRQPIAQNIGLDVSSLTKADYLAVLEQYILKANELRGQLELEQRSKDGVRHDLEEFMVQDTLYDSFLSKSQIKIKEPISSKLISYFTVSGYFNPFTAEVQVNQEIPKAGYPFVNVHELAHQMGVGFEDDCNFIAFRKLVNHPNLWYQYSAYYNAIQSLLEPLYADKELLEKYKSMLSAPVREDLREEYAFWHSYRGWLDKISSLFYNQYLIHNNQPEGLERYNMMAKLIVAWEKQQ